MVYFIQLGKNTVKLFFSYTVRDGYIDRSFLADLCNSIPSKIQPFVDLLHNDSVDFQRRIYTEIVGSDLCIALQSPLFFTSPWARYELELCHSLEKSISIVLVSRSDRVEHVAEAVREASRDHARLPFGTIAPTPLSYVRFPRLCGSHGYPIGTPRCWCSK